MNLNLPTDPSGASIEIVSVTPVDRGYYEIAPGVPTDPALSARWRYWQGTTDLTPAEKQRHADLLVAQAHLVAERREAREAAGVNPGPAWPLALASEDLPSLASADIVAFLRDERGMDRCEAEATVGRLLA